MSTANGRSDGAGRPGGRHRAVATPPRVPSGFRPDVQGLRAVAVSLVVIYHLYPDALPGGYVGVDVFFAISGFLITGHLLRTVRTTGRVGFVDFYGRRARRLMPAAVLVLAATWLASWAVLPSTQLAATATQVRASALYFQNWVLAHDAVDYLTADDAPSPVQHFWSLSVEEQFYLFWPLLVLVALGVGTLAARRLRAAGATDERVAARRAARTRGVMFLLAVAVVAVSFWYSVHETRVNPSAAYFVTTTRVWELALGAALALLTDRVASRVGRVGVLGWLGLGLVVASAFLIDEGSPFPGSVAALPVGGAVLLLASGSSVAKLGPSRLMSLRPVVFVGDISYSLYLWHWPLIILWEAHSGDDIGYLDGPVLLVVAVLLSWATKVFVEDRVRLAGILAGHRWRSLATVATAAVPVLLASIYIGNEPAPYHATVQADRPGAASLLQDAAGSSTPSATPTTGAAAGASSSSASPRRSATKATPASRSAVPFAPPVEAAEQDMGAYTKGPGGCQAAQTSSDLLSCTYGDTKHPIRTVALVGDSVAGQWFPALNAIALERHWKLVLNLHSLCPWSATMTVTGDGEAYRACHTWGAKLTAALLKQRPDVVITSARPSLGTTDHPEVGTAAWRAIGSGAVAYWNRLTAAGIPVVPIAETPEMHKDVPDCLASTDDDFDQCSATRSDALRPGTPMVVAARRTQAHAVTMNDLVCAPKVCKPVVGNILVYRDKHHITQTFMLTLKPFLEKRLLATKAFD
ncbi:Peptidoglycan/LPS O-acetylase OafA/YrhL, contains acyltransferase and SGNH-hydrolase domains [Jatrophihabitans endophyticus]|uniref:Peptidoglycan/LPS O-acetylase OafA/YrhL, contains acyltransferase and SGNH-hydrolase domains n=1 Tax=Jatrophihabitans endophyticus TaxID=1206085 RepID=A0A1M5I414_9ACTN|nr:acyltransferase family protein [Jatrophihabitans endophyticus]SHG22887.1 Peptidoglycan/LPS O-acetylase OafA/YrhL, contains acyltransferase and SGNH-hydrolase domains [Jatrophihabitans endophyticus]